MEPSVCVVDRDDIKELIGTRAGGNPGIGEPSAEKVATVLSTEIAVRTVWVIGVVSSAKISILVASSCKIVLVVSSREIAIMVISSIILLVTTVTFPIDALSRGPCASILRGWDENLRRTVGWTIIRFIEFHRQMRQTRSDIRDRILSKHLCIIQELIARTTVIAWNCLHSPVTFYPGRSTWGLVFQEADFLAGLPRSRSIPP